MDAIFDLLSFAAGLSIGLVLLWVQHLRHRAAMKHKHDMTLLEAADLLKVETELTLAIRREQLRGYDFEGPVRGK